MLLNRMQVTIGILTLQLSNQDWTNLHTILD